MKPAIAHTQRIIEIKVSTSGYAPVTLRKADGMEAEIHISVPQGGTWLSVHALDSLIKALEELKNGTGDDV